jgi:hypothetical protein
MCTIRYTPNNLSETQNWLKEVNIPLIIRAQPSAKCPEEARSLR